MRHHVDVSCNESVFGFFGFPLFDILFGTLITPKTLFPDGKRAPKGEFGPTNPSPVIKSLDTLLLRFAKFK